MAVGETQGACLPYFEPFCLSLPPIGAGGSGGVGPHVITVEVVGSLVVVSVETVKSPVVVAGDGEVLGCLICAGLTKSPVALAAEVWRAPAMAWRVRLRTADESCFSIPPSPAEASLPCKGRRKSAADVKVVELLVSAETLEAYLTRVPWCCYGVRRSQTQ